MRANLREIASAIDPKKAILAAVGDLEDIMIFHNNVLVATFIQSEKTTGGVYLPDKTLVEDRFQGKVGLVLKCGPLAFKDDAVVKFGGVTVERGDWVIYRPSDGLEQFVKCKSSRDGVACRLIEDALIKGRVADPGMIY